MKEQSPFKNSESVTLFKDTYCISTDSLNIKLTESSEMLPYSVKREGIT